MEHSSIIITRITDSGVYKMALSVSYSHCYHCQSATTTTTTVSQLASLRILHPIDTNSHDFTEQKDKVKVPSLCNVRGQEEIAVSKANG